MRRAIWELSPLILFSLWLFGALPLIYSNGVPVNIVSTWSIDFVSAWKAISIVFTGAFGLMGLLTEFKNKETGKLTRWGKVSFGGIVLSAALGVIAQLKENTDEAQRREASATHALQLLKQTNGAVLDIQRLLSPLDILELSIYFQGTCEDQQFAKFCAQASNFLSISTIENPDLWKTWPEQQAILAVNLYFFRDPPNLQKLEQDFMGDADSDLSVHIPASNYAKDKSLQLSWQSGKPHLAIVNFVPYPFFVRATGKISSLVDVQDASLIIASPHDGLAVLTPTWFRIKTKQGRELEIDTAKLHKISVGKRTAYLYKFEKQARSLEEEKTLPPK